MTTARMRARRIVAILEPYMASLSSDELGTCTTDVDKLIRMDRDETTNELRVALRTFPMSTSCTLTYFKVPT